MPRCENCDREFAHTDDLDHEEASEFELDDSDDGPPRITIGTGSTMSGAARAVGKYWAFADYPARSNRVTGTDQTSPKTAL
ncbi:hypothetical protein ACFQL1_08815 [Halomicroarcula sp. GCM10025709]|uniref:hypothetical protein n=1 Tax=Halomicroarcula sp. GCM10025709 TaxID=3252669 RepID=UPI0036200CEC